MVPTTMNRLPVQPSCRRSWCGNGRRHSTRTAVQVSSVLAWVAILVCVSQVVLVGASAVASSASTQPSHGSSMPDITETPHGSERAASGAEASHKVELEGSKRAGATNDASQPDGAVVRDHADQPTGRAHDTKADESFRAKPRTLRRRQRNKWPVPTPAPHVVFASIALRGHITPLLRMAREMVVRGYRVTVATNPRGSIWVNSTGAEFVSAGSLPVAPTEVQSVLSQSSQDPSTFRGVLALLGRLYLPAGAAFFESLDAFVSSERPDLMVVDVATIGARDVGIRYGVPVVVNNPTLLPLKQGFPGYLPAWGTGFVPDMSLTARAMNLLFPRLLSVALTPAFMQLNKLRWAQGLQSARSQHDLFMDAPVICNTAFGFDLARPVSPDVFFVGPIMPPLIRTRGLPGSLQRFFDGKTTATSPKHRSSSKDSPATGVYLRLGAMTFADATLIQRIVQGLLLPDVRVLWSVPTDQQSNVPLQLPQSFKVRTSESTPNFKVLASKSVHVVISHCGLAAAQEALYFGKPLLCIPFFGDQPDVAARVVHSGAGLVIDKVRFDPTEMSQRIIDLRHNRTFARHARRIARVLRRAGGVRKAADILESELRIGSDHLRTTDAMLAWHQRTMLDVACVYVAFMLVIACVFRLFGVAVAVSCRGKR